MKVADGFWLSKKGYEVNYASQAYKVETTENAIKVLATPYTVMNRGMTLGGPNLEITYSSTCENTIKVHIDHYRGGLDNIPRFELNEDPNFKPVINRSEDSVELISGDTKVVIRIADDWDVQFYYKDRHLTGWWHGDQHRSSMKTSSMQMHVWNYRKMIRTSTIHRIQTAHISESS